MPTKCFLLEPTDQQRIWLRRYRSGTDVERCATNGYHTARSLPLGDFPKDAALPDVPHDDPRWPGRCPCGYLFTDDDAWQVFTEYLYRRTDTDDILPLSAAPAGAIWDATWMHECPNLCGPDGKSLICMTPGGEWSIDGPASNCTMPGETTHRCWIRHGEPPDLTVDKAGNTCLAGAGSIQAGSYHGFLRGGWLVE